MRLTQALAVTSEERGQSHQLIVFETKYTEPVTMQNYVDAIVGSSHSDRGVWLRCRLACG